MATDAEVVLTGMLRTRPGSLPDDYGPCLGSQVKFHLPSWFFLTKAWP